MPVPGGTPSRGTPAVPEPVSVAGLERRQRPDAAGHDEVVRDGVDGRRRPIGVDEVGDEAEREQLVRAERRVVAVRSVDDVVEPAAVVDREAGAERCGGAGRAGAAWLERGGASPSSPPSGPRAGTPRSTAPGSRPACRAGRDDDAVDLRVHPGQLQARLAAADEAVGGIHADADRVPLA